MQTDRVTSANTADDLRALLVLKASNFFNFWHMADMKANAGITDTEVEALVMLQVLEADYNNLGKLIQKLHGAVDKVIGERLGQETPRHSLQASTSGRLGNEPAVSEKRAAAAMEGEGATPSKHLPRKKLAVSVPPQPSMNGMEDDAFPPTLAYVDE